METDGVFGTHGDAAAAEGTNDTQAQGLELDWVVARTEFRPELSKVFEAGEGRGLGKVNDAPDDSMNHLRIP